MHRVATILGHAVHRSLRRRDWRGERKPFRHAPARFYGLRPRHGITKLIGSTNTTDKERMALENEAKKLVLDYTTKVGDQLHWISRSA